MALGGQLYLSFDVAKDEQEMTCPRDSIREFASPEKSNAATAHIFGKFQQPLPFVPCASKVSSVAGRRGYCLPRQKIVDSDVGIKESEWNILPKTALS